MKIRRFIKEDLDQILNLCREIREYHINILGGYFTQQNDAIEQEGFLASLSDIKTVALVAEENNNIYGYLLAEERISPHLQHPKIAHIINFGVMEKYRRQGIGKMLMNVFYEICSEREIDEIRLGVFNINQRAYKFYESYGFEPFEQRMKLEVKK